MSASQLGWTFENNPKTQKIYIQYMVPCLSICDNYANLWFLCMFSFLKYDMNYCRPIRKLNGKLWDKFGNDYFKKELHIFKYR